MSEIFEGIVYPAPPVSESRLHSELPLETRVLDQGLAVSFRQDGRSRATFDAEMEELAAACSNQRRRALLVRFDSRIGHRSAVLFEFGQRVRSFGGADELFVPLDERGLPVASARPLPAHELHPSMEYETSTNAIQLGLQSLGSNAWEALFAVMTAPI